LDAGFQDAIMNLPMEQKRTVSIRTGGGADLAFALVVLAAFFATFNSIKNASVVEIFLMISLGIAYSTVGIYGLCLCEPVYHIFIQAGLLCHTDHSGRSGGQFGECSKFQYDDLFTPGWS
jgi:hypothetical protein